MTTLIRQYTPMAPTLVRVPFHRVGWIYEEKVDGYRMLAYKDGARARLVSRNGVDHIRRYRTSRRRSRGCGRPRSSSTANWRCSTSSCGRGSSGFATRTSP